MFARNLLRDPRLGILLLFFLLVSGLGGFQPAPAVAGPPAQTDPAAAYCREQGGQIVTRQAAYNTGASPDKWLILAGVRDFCEFDSAPDSSGFSSRISIAADTLYADQPTLALLAYLHAAPPTAAPPGGANPATYYCNQLGGTAIWGAVGSNGAGGWTNAQQPIFTVMDTCVFPDNSTIDEWGLTYHGAGTIRGTDLSKVARYQPAQVPAVFSGLGPPFGLPVDKPTPARAGGLGAAPPLARSGLGATPPAPGATPPADPAAAYCVAKGGKVITRQATYNTGGDQQDWLPMAGVRDFCEFDSPADANGFSSRISIATDTLYTDQPTLAVLAYLSAPPVPPTDPSVNPATLYCTTLGGTSIWGGTNNVAGGGWTNTQEPIFTVMDACLFPDGSTIDQWGLTYHAGGVIRGIDLASVVRYNPPTHPVIRPGTAPEAGGPDIGAAPGSVGAVRGPGLGAAPGMPRTGAPGAIWPAILALSGLLLLGLGWLAARRRPASV